MRVGKKNLIKKKLRSLYGEGVKEKESKGKWGCKKKKSKQWTLCKLNIINRLTIIMYACMPAGKTVTLIIGWSSFLDKKNWRWNVLCMNFTSNKKGFRWLIEKKGNNKYL